MGAVRQGLGGAVSRSEAGSGRLGLWGVVSRARVGDGERGGKQDSRQGLPVLRSSPHRSQSPCLSRPESSVSQP